MKKFNKKCKVCKKEFVSMNSRKIFCSNACKTKDSKINNRKEYSHECKNCGIDFISHERKTKYCSFSCSGIGRNKKGTGKFITCKQCGNEFLQKHKRHYFCSTECKRHYNDVPLETTNCSNCYILIERPRNLIGKERNFFCSKKCEIEFRSKQSEDIRTCEICEKEFSCNKSEKLRFCSMSCQNEWQRRTNFGKNHPSYKHDITDEMRVKNCECCGIQMTGTPKEFEVKKYCSYACKTRMNPKTMSVPHKKTIQILVELNVDHDTEMKLGRYSIDCKIKNKPLCIEVMGEFWHCDNRKYEKPISPIQEKSIIRDARKKKEIYNQLNFVLYIWEKDINEEYDLCKNLILDFIDRNGKIDNFHSMNYILVDGKLILSNKILIPFFER